MPLVGRPTVTKSLPKGLGVDTVSGSTTAIDADKSSPRYTDWAERDRALVLTGLLAGLRTDELPRANVGATSGPLTPAVSSKSAARARRIAGSLLSSRWSM